jgi:hypothetical protein
MPLRGENHAAAAIVDSQHAVPITTRHPGFMKGAVSRGQENAEKAKPRLRLDRVTFSFGKRERPASMGRYAPAGHASLAASCSVSPSRGIRSCCGETPCSVEYRLSSSRLTVAWSSESM